MSVIAERHSRHNRVERVRRLLKEPNARVGALMGALHPSEVADVLEECPPHVQERLLKELPRELISEALTEMEEDTNPSLLLTHFQPAIAAELLSDLDPDDAADLLADLPEPFKDQVLHHLPNEEEDVLNQLLTYDEDTAGGIMNPEVMVVREEMTKLEALREVVNQSEEMEEFYIIYVLDENDHLAGYLTFKTLFTSKNHEQVREIMGTDIVSVSADTDQEHVAQVMAQYNLPALPVVDKNNQLLGRVTFDDVMDVLEEESTEDILNFAGVSDGENIRGGWAAAVRSRLPWLAINMITASAAGIVITQFDQTIGRVVVLAALMPIIAGVAGNSAIQTLAVTLRRISTDRIPRQQAIRIILKEISVGTLTGLMVGSVLAIAVMILSPAGTAPQFGAMLGLVVFLAMFGNIFLGALAGAFVPIALQRLGADPAVASSIFITAFTDIMGFFQLLGLASLLLLPYVSTLRQAALTLIDPVIG